MIEKQELLCFRNDPDYDLRAVRLSDNFSLHEFRCRCKVCPYIFVSPRLVNALQQIRNRLAMQVIVTNGYRCQVHNTVVGGSRTSRHLTGQAVDFKVADRDEQTMNIEAAYAIARELPEVGAVGRYVDKAGKLKRIHIDVRPFYDGKHQTVWTKPAEAEE